LLLFCFSYSQQQSRRRTGRSRAWRPRRGIANKNEVTVRALAWIIAGHDLHHRQILEERYFEATAA